MFGLDLTMDIPVVFLHGPVDGRESVEVKVRHDDVGVVPSFSWIGGPSLVTEIRLRAPDEMGFVERYHKPMGARRGGEEHNAVDGVVMIKVADFITRKRQSIGVVVIIVVVVERTGSEDDARDQQEKQSA